MSAQLDVRGIHLDAALTAAVIALMSFGAVMVGSASISLADRDMGEPLFFLYRHVGALVLGLAGGALVMLTPMRVWFHLHGVLLLVALGALAAVFVPGLGTTVNGSTRWLDFGAFTLQASELARLSFTLYLAGYVVRHQAAMTENLWGFLKPALLVAVAASLLLAEPDFGAAVVLTATSLAILFVGGARLVHFSLALGTACGLLASLALSSGYRLERLTGFMDPWADPYASGFQLTQSLIAFGRGEWLGVGLGDSVQKLFYLPEAHTDFVFAVLAEELGVLGASFVIVLFGIVVVKAIALGPRGAAVGLPFQGLVSTGVGFSLGLQAFINIGVNVGLLPTKGLTLPLISYGRSSAVITLIALALLMRAHHEISDAERRMPGRRSGRRAR